MRGAGRNSELAMSARKSAVAAAPANAAALKNTLATPAENIFPKEKSSRAAKARVRPSGVTAGDLKWSARKLQCEKKMQNNLKSLQMAHDPRMEEIDSFQKLMNKRITTQNRIRNTSNHPSSGPEASSQSPLSPALVREPEPPVSPTLGGDGFDDRPHLVRKKDAGETICEKTNAWQMARDEAFSNTMRRLMIDFELSDDADCKLHHLERLHSWFTESHGLKKVRKQIDPPKFLALEVPHGGVAGRWPKGCPRNNDAPLSDRALTLSGTMRMRKSAQLEAAAARPFTAR